MSKYNLIIVEIIYKDPKSRVLKSATGKISKHEINNFNENENSFIILQGKQVPISKMAITEVIIYSEFERFPVKNGRRLNNHQFVRDFRASISF